MASDITYHRLKYSQLLWVALGFGIFVVVALYSARMTWTYPDYDSGRAAQRKITLAKVQKAEDALLHPVDDKGNPVPAAWVDQDKGLIQIPIEEAMTHEVADLKSVPVGIGAVIPGSTPAPAPPPPAAPATNAAPAKPAAPPAAPAKPKKKKKAAPAATTSGTVLTPGTINLPVFDVRNVKKAPGTTFQCLITYGTPIDPSIGNSVMQVPTTGTN